MNNTIFSFDNLLQSHHVTFSHQWHTLSLPHSYNQRIYLGLCLLSKLVNSQLFSVRLYDRQRFSLKTNFSLECWEYLVGRLKGGVDVVVKRHLSRVRLRCFPDLSLEKDRVGSQTCTTIVFVSDADVVVLRSILGISFGLGVKKRVRVGDGRVGLALGDTLFGINPMDGGGDCITFKYDVGAGLLCICMTFTRVVVGNQADPTAISMINKIKHNIDHLLTDDGDV